MIKKLQTGINQRKVRVFLIFLICSLAAWLVSRLSQTYTHTVDFKLEYSNAPEGLIMMEEPPEQIGVRLRANGFQLLGYQLSPKKVRINLDDAEVNNRGYYISPQSYRDQIEGQLRQGIGLLQIPADTIFMNFQQLQNKTVPVKVPASLDFAQNYMLDGPLVVEPGQIHLLGPPAEIDTITEVHTEPLNISDIKEDFQLELTLWESVVLEHTQFSQDRIRVSGTVFRFSETVVEVPVEVINLPEGIEIQTFPGVVGVLCKGRITGLKELRAGKFRLVADYSAPESETGRLMLELIEKPTGVYETQLLEASVEFIIKRD
ncbi:MAG: YbbR-like domain-containing protein [Robiginitalea sp.]